MTQTVSLGNYIEIIGGGTPKTSNSDFWGGDIPWLSVVDFGGDRRWVGSAEKHITQLGLQGSSTKLLRRGDIIISARGTVGELAQLKMPMAFNQSCYGIRAREGVEQDFLYYLLKSSIADLQRQSHGGVFSTITRETFRRIKIEMPDLETQKQIANILGTIDEKIELNWRMNETLEQMGQALFRHYFIDNTEAERWGSVVLGDKIKPRRGKSLQSKNMKPGAVPVISGGLKPAGLHDESNTIAPVITISASGANAGFTALWDEDVWSADSSFIDTTITPHVYFYYLFLSRNQKRIYEMQTGSGQPHIYPSHLELLELPNAPELLIAEFNERVSANFKKIEENKKQVQTLTTLRDTLLPRLISGKAKV